MSRFNRHTFFAAALVAALLVADHAQAQSSQDMQLLSQEEHQAYTKRLQHAMSSADRSRITAEMNRIVQQRRLELRQTKGQGQNQGQNQDKPK